MCDLLYYKNITLSTINVLALMVKTQKNDKWGLHKKIYRAKKRAGWRRLGIAFASRGAVYDKSLAFSVSCDIIKKYKKR